MTNLRNIYIFTTKDNYFTKISKDIVKDILSKEEFIFFDKLNKEQQLAYLNFKEFNLGDILNNTSHAFLFLIKKI